MTQLLEIWVYVVQEWRENRETGGDDANVGLDVEPYSQINEGVGCIRPVNPVDEEDANDGRYADAYCWEKLESAVVCALQSHDRME